MAPHRFAWQQSSESERAWHFNDTPPPSLFMLSRATGFLLLADEYSDFTPKTTSYTLKAKMRWQGCMNSPPGPETNFQ